LFFLGTQLQILNAEAYAKLMIFLDRKSSLLREVTDVLSQKLLPLSPNDELEALLLSGFELPEEDYPRDRWSLREKIRSKLHDWAIPFSGTPPWDANTYKKIEIYLDSGKPRQQLDEIRAALEQLYNTLKENFSIEDILPKVSGRRPDPRNH
jgi:hypothetical protein